MDGENYEDVSLELGAIIKIISESKSILHNKYFLIDYLDNDKIIIIDQNKTSRKLSIKDGTIEDTSITQIIVVDRPEHPGFAKQNEMEIGTWWSIHFAFDGGEIIKGKIVGLENDQIELQSPQYPDTPLVIDFQYKGIPEDLNIISIRRWDKDDADDEGEEEEGEEEEEETEDLEGLITLLDDELIPDQVFDSKEVEDTLKNDLISADNIKIIKKDVIVTQLKNRAEKDRIFDIEYQTEDLLDNLLSKIHENNRDQRIENKIHLSINRYLELREKYSNYDIENYIVGANVKTKNHKPLLENLHNLNTNLEWIVPIVKNRKQIIDIQNISEIEDDIIITSTEDILTDAIDFQKNMENDITPDGINKYIYAYGKADTNTELPFDKTGLIIEQNANDRYDTIVDNLNDYNSSAIKQITNFEICIDDGKKLPDDSTIHATTIKFQTQIYNGEKKTPIYDVRNGKKAVLRKFINADKVPLAGFILFPGLINYSKLYLKNTNLYAKSSINLNESNKYKLFRFMRNENKFMGKQYLFDKDDKKMFHDKFLKHISEYKFKDNENWDEKSIEDNKDNYKEFLDNIIPNTREIIKKVYTDLSDNFIKITSYQKFVDYLEPFSIYSEDIEFSHYVQIQKALEHSIKEHFKDIGWSRNNINDFLTSVKSYNNPSSFFDFFKSKSVFNGIDCKCYGFDETETNTEYLKKILDYDNGRSFNNCVALNDINNINYESIPDKIETLKVEISNIKNSMEDGGDCTLNPKILAKKMDNYELLRKDDKIDIYFDKLYDDTPYDIYDELTHIKHMDDVIKKKSLLKEHLTNAIGLPEDKAERDSDSMINRKKKVIDGEYAMVDTGEYQYRYYIRDNQKWVLDDTLNDLSPEELNFVNCNMKRKCMTINDKCLNIKNQTGKLQEELIAETIENLETDMLEQINTVKTNLEKEIKYNIDNLTLLRKRQQNKFLQYDIKRVKLSSQLEIEENEHSPYITIRDKMLIDTNEINKYNNIIKFCDGYCRNYSKEKDESPYWFYCKKSDEDGSIKSKKLLPTFFRELAESYINGTYESVLLKIIDDRGKISREHADKYVDEHSGFVISDVMHLDEERYEKSGQKIITRDLLDTTDDDAVKAKTEILLKESTEEEELKGDEKIIKDILKTYDENFGFNTKKKWEWMYQFVKKLIKKSRQRKTAFDAKTKEMAKEKKDPKYKRDWTKYHHKFIFKSVISVYAIIIQTSIPSIKQAKDVQPCKVELEGFPIMGSGLGFLEYLTCSTLKFRVKNGEPPWNSLKKVKTKDQIKPETTKFAKEIKSWIEKYYMKDIEITSLIETKTAYLKIEEKKKLLKPREIDNLWPTFLPPLVRITPRKIEKMGDGYDKRIISSYKNVSQDSITRLNKLRSKIQTLSFGIIESMQNIMDKQPLILKTEDDVPYTENNCCNDNNVLNTYEYFVTLDDTIQKYNDLVAKYKKVLHVHLDLTIAPSLISQIDARKVKSIRSNIFSESTIYLSFIKYCDFNSGIPLNESLKQLCDKNNSEIKKYDTIEDKIDILKGEGHNWNDSALKELLLYISRKNVENQNLIEEDSSIIFDKAKNIPSSRQIFENWINALNTTTTTVRGLDVLTPIMEKLYDTYDVTQQARDTDKGEINFVDEVAERINYNNKTLSKNIAGKLKKIQKTKHTINFIETLPEFNKRGEGIFMSVEDETNYSLTEVIKNMIKDMLITFPNIIKNESNRFSMKKIVMPPHWGFGSKKFSLNHINQLKKAISPLNLLEKFSCDEDCKFIMNKIIEKGKDILDFVKLLPFLSNLGKNKTIFNGGIHRAVICNLFYLTIFLYYEIIEEIVGNKFNKDDPNEESEYYGALEDYEIMVSNIINTYLNIFMNTKKILNQDPGTIKNNVLKEKEMEKENIKDQFNRLDDEHRKIERELKKHKLGEWSVGLSKAIFQYDPDMYDREIQQQQQINEMLNRNNITLSSAEENNQNNMFSGLSGAATDLLMQQQAEHEIHGEMYGMMGEMGDEEDMDSRDDLY